MRKTLLIFGLVGLAVLAHTSEAMAQRGGGRSGGGRSYNGGGGGRSYYGGGGRSYYGDGMGYGSGISIGLGLGGYYSPYGYYDGLGYGSDYSGYGNAYQLAPDYYVAPTQVQQSYYSGPAPVQQGANVTVLVPAGAQIWFGDSPTTQQGTERLFHSPPLEPNHKFSYAVKARWMVNGKEVIRERQVSVQSGQNVTVDFRENAPENLAQPLPRKPDAAPRD